MNRSPPAIFIHSIIHTLSLAFSLASLFVPSFRNAEYLMCGWYFFLSCKKLFLFKDTVRYTCMYKGIEKQLKNIIIITKI